MRKNWAAPRPVYDETISSWLCRCAYNSECAPLVIADLNEISITMPKSETAETSHLPDVNFDFNTENALALKLVEYYNMPKRVLSGVFGSHGEPVLAPYSCTAYCPECMENDVKNYGLPAWRKNWCYVHAPICRFHRSLLLTTSDFQYTKAFSAYADQIPLEPDANKSNMLETAIRNRLAYRVQIWLSKLYTIIYYNSSTNSHCEIINCIEIILKRILRMPSPRFPGGLADNLFSPRYSRGLADYYTLNQLEDLGWVMSSPRLRMGALLVLGYLVGLFSKAEVEWLIFFFREKSAFYNLTHDKLVKFLFPANNHLEAYLTLLPFLKIAKSKAAIEFLTPFLKKVITNCNDKQGLPRKWHCIKKPVLFDSTLAWLVERGILSR
ncbi:TniQ family protein [Pseudomonas matsuisoli]|uniref:TniQ family protein n=1 Tax=Pseudomonas matsuisoli TaxID=1515666 RepID=UPI00166C773C|nr:TniQ family protein [Pseudomonas matsuisoli]